MLKGRVRGQRSDVEKANPGGTDMEIIIVELGLYDHITTGIQRHVTLTLSNPTDDSSTIIVTQNTCMLYTICTNPLISTNE